MKNINYILYSILIVLLIVWSLQRGCINKKRDEINYLKFRYDDLKDKYDENNETRDTVLKIILGQKMIIDAKSKEIKRSEDIIDSLNKILVNEILNDSLKQKDADNLEKALDILSSLYEQKGVDYANLIDSLDADTAYINLKNQLEILLKKNSEKQDSIFELKRNTFGLKIIGNKTLNSSGEEIRMAKKISKIVVYYDITDCIFTRQEILAKFFDPQGNLVVRRYRSGEIYSYINTVDRPVKDSLSIIITNKNHLRLGGDYKIVFSDEHNRTLDSVKIVVYDK